MKRRWILSELSCGPVWLSLPQKAAKKKRATKRAIERRRKLFDDTMPHHGDDLIRALEFENFMRDDYVKGKAK